MPTALRVCGRSLAARRDRPIHQLGGVGVPREVLRRCGAGGRGELGRHQDDAVGGQGGTAGGQPDREDRPPQGDAGERHRPVRASGEHGTDAQDSRPQCRHGESRQHPPALQIPRVVVPGGYNRIVYEPQFALNPDRTNYVSVLRPGTPQSLLPHPMPIAITFFAGPGDEPTLLKAASAYEAATKHRVPPPAFGPVAGEP